MGGDIRESSSLEVSVWCVVLLCIGADVITEVVLDSDFLI